MDRAMTGLTRSPHHTDQMKNMTRYCKSVLSAALLSISCCSLVYAQSASEPAPVEQAPGQAAQLTLDDLRTFTDIFNQARKNYVEQVDDQTLLNAAIRGMLHELDPHSSYLPAKELEQLNDSALGRYSGIGIEVQDRDGKVVINAIINGSPADQAGLNPGDVITSINGIPVEGRPSNEAMDELQGKPDSNVVMHVISAEGEERDVEITRQYIKLPTLSFELLDGSIGYFRMTQFHQDSATDLENSLESIKSDGIGLDAVIIDLRGNPGGVLRQAVAMADGFLDEGGIVSTRGRNSTMQLEFNATPGQWLPGVPLMILVDHGTASASEVLAGALQDNGRAVIVGERTFGKGSVQSVLPLRNGAGIKLTTARYYTPSGRSIQAEGILPDVVIEWTEDSTGEDEQRREVDLDRHLGHESQEPANAPAPENAALENFPLEELLQALQNAEIIPNQAP
jgi:carboxyl-terminal processing protease